MSTIRKAALGALALALLSSAPASAKPTDVRVVNSAQDPVLATLVGTPAVSIAGLPPVELAGTPQVELAGQPEVQLAGTPQVEVAGPEPYQRFLQAVDTGSDASSACTQVPVPSGQRLHVEGIHADVRRTSQSDLTEVEIAADAAGEGASVAIELNDGVGNSESGRLAVPLLAGVIGGETHRVRLCAQVFGSGEVTAHFIVTGALFPAS